MTVAALFNDRTTFAWVIVVCYFAGAGASVGAWTRAESREQRFWLATAILLVLLGLNKELDLRFCFGYTPLEFRDTLKLLAEGRVDPRPLITGTVGLDGVAPWAHAAAGAFSTRIFFGAGFRLEAENASSQSSSLSRPCSCSSGRSNDAPWSCSVAHRSPTWASKPKP